MHPGMVIMHPRMAIIASGMEISRWRSIHPGMAIDASRDGDRYIPGWRSMHPGMVIIAIRDGDLEMVIDASRDGDR